MNSNNWRSSVRSVTFLIILSSLVISLQGAVTVSSFDPSKRQNTESARFDSTIESMPLRNDLKFYIGILSYQWLQNYLNQGQNLGYISQVGLTPNYWNIESPTGNYFLVSSYWEYATVNSFSFSIPDDSLVQYSLIVYSNSLSSTYLNKVEDFEVFNAVPSRLKPSKINEGFNISNRQMYDLEAGDYSIYQTSTSNGAGTTNYFFYTRSIPQPSSGMLFLSSISALIAYRRRQS